MGNNKLCAILALSAVLAYNCHAMDKKKDKETASPLNNIFSLAGNMWWDAMGRAGNSMVQTPAVENAKVFLQFNENLTGIKSLIDKKTGRQFAIGIESPVYSIGFGNNYDSMKVVRSVDADRSSFKKSDDGLELSYWHEKDVKLKVTCTVNTKKADTLMHWSVKIENLSCLSGNRR